MEPEKMVLIPMPDVSPSEQRCWEGQVVEHGGRSAGEPGVRLRATPGDGE